MGNTEIFELCETSSKKPWPRLYLIFGKLALCIVHVEMSNTLRKAPKRWTRKTSTPLSIPSYVIKKNLLRGAKHGASEPNVLQSQGDVAESSPTQASWRQNHFGRWHNDDKYHESLSKIGWTEEQIIQYDELALITPILQQEGKEIEMRKVEYSSWIKNVLKDQWINDMISLKQNEKWNDWMMNMWKRLQKEYHPLILYNHQDNEDTNNLKDLKNVTIKSMPKQDGRPVLRSHRETCRGIQHIRPRQLSENSTTIGNRTKVGILGDLHPGLNSSDFLVQRDVFFRLPESEFPGNRRRV